MPLVQFVPLIDPDPDPAVETVRAAPLDENVAMIVELAVIVPEQVPVPVQPSVPDHPVKVDPPAGVAVQAPMLVPLV